MKKLKLLLLLFLPFWAIGQVSTGQEQEFDYGIKNNSAQTVSTPTYLTTTGTDGTQGKIPFALVNTGESRVAVNDANYTITGTTNRLIAYTNITANRNVTLPPATTANQRIWITDESSLASAARMIIVLPNGSDLIGGATNAVVNFPNGSGYFESDGSGKWNIISTTSVQLSAGVSSIPTITDLGAGSVTLGNGVYTMFANANGSGRPKSFAIAGSTFALTDQMTNYITAQYNTTTGAVSLVVTTTESVINYTTIIPVFKVYRDGTSLHIADYDSLGLALSNKLQKSWEKTQQFRFEPGGVLLGESATRVITVSSGTAWKGGIEIPLTAVASNVQTCYQFVNTSGTWSKSVVTQYNNTQYNATGGLATLTSNSYAVNFVYRSVGQDTGMAIVLGTGDYSLGQAQVAPEPANIPSFITSHMVLVGRIIVQKNATTSTQIDRNNQMGTNFTSAGVTDHNALNNLQTAQTGVTYGHITDGTQTIAGAKTYSSNIASTGFVKSGATTTDALLAGGGSLSNPISGTGTTSFLPKFIGTTTLGNSIVYDNGTNIGIGTINPQDKLHVVGNTQIDTDIILGHIGDTNRITSRETGQQLVVGGSDTFKIQTYSSGWQDRLLVVNNGSLLVGTSTDNGSKGQFNGTVSGSDATASNHFITKSQHDSKANIASPSLTGTPTAPTASAGTNTTQIATTAFVTSSIPNTSSGTYTVTITPLSNFTIGTISKEAYYQRIGDIVSVTVHLSGVSSTLGTGQTAFTASLPFNRTSALPRNIGNGTAHSFTTAANVPIFIQSSDFDKCNVSYTTMDVGDTSMSFTFRYTVN